MITTSYLMCCVTFLLLIDGNASQYQISSDCFIDYDNDTLSLSIQSTEGKDITWINLDSSNQKMLFAPIETTSGNYACAITILDSKGGSSTYPISIVVTNSAHKDPIPPGNNSTNNGTSSNNTNPSTNTSSTEGGLPIMIIAAGGGGGLLLLILVILYLRRKRKVHLTPVGQNNASTVQTQENHVEGQSTSRLYLNHQSTIPASFLSPISSEIMVDPVTVTFEDDTFLYFEKDEIVNWFKANTLDPVSRKKKKKIEDNKALETEIENFLITVQSLQMKNKPELAEKVGTWVKKRGRKQLVEDSRLKCIVERLDGVLLR